MTEEKILELAMKTHLVAGWKITAGRSFLSSTVQWEPVDENYFKQCLLNYTEEVIRLAHEDILKDVTVTSKTGGEVVAITLTDEEHRIYKVLWEKNK